jgi:hypothetical protein
MKIGWARLTMLIELDLNIVTTGYAEMRTGYMRSLIEAGHTIKILTGMGNKSEDTWQRVNSVGYEPQEQKYNVDWLKSVEYDPKAFADDCELLIVENSACNWMFGCKYTGQPSIRRCVDILNSYTGLVIIEQSDPDLPFPFGKMSLAEFGWSHPDNPSKAGTEKDFDELEKWGWADPFEIWDDKRYLVTTRGLDIEAVIKEGMFNGIRFQYQKLQEEGAIGVVCVPQTWDFDCIAGNIGFNENPKYEMIFTGYPRTDSRERDFCDIFLSLSPIIDRAVCGPWEKAKRQDLKNQLLYNYIEYVGNLAWCELPEFIHQSKFSLFLAVKRSYNLNWQTNKPFEAISCGSVLLFNEMPYLAEWFGVDFVINAFNVDKWAYIIKHITEEDRKTLWQFQFERIRHKDWNYFLVELQSHLKKNGFDKKLIKKKKIDEPTYEVNDVTDIIKKYEEQYLADKEWQTRYGSAFEEKRLRMLAEIESVFNPPECYGTYDNGEYQCSICPFWDKCKQEKENPTIEEVVEVEETTETAEITETVKQEITSVTQPIIECEILPNLAEISGNKSITLKYSEASDFRMDRAGSIVVIHASNVKDLRIDISLI